MTTSSTCADPAGQAHSVVAAAAPEKLAGWKPDRRPIGLSLVERPCLTLVQPSPEDTPSSWKSAIVRLTDWLDLDHVQIPQAPASGLQRVKVWAKSALSSLDRAAPGAPLFAPWKCMSPISFQQPGSSNLPRARWIGSYLYDYGTGKGSGRGVADIQLMSPLPAACLPEDDPDAQTPSPSVLKAMIQAARAEQREKIVIVTDVRRRNALIRHLLVVDKSVTRDGPQIEVLSIENTLCKLAQGRSSWDAIIVLPDLRSLVFALLAQIYGIQGPWPMLWHYRDVTMICAEALDETVGDLPFDAPLLVQALALAARQAEFNVSAQKLMQGAIRLWDSGIVTPGRGSSAPYVTQISDHDFIEQLCRNGASAQRTVAGWRALAPVPDATKAPRPAQLHLVTAN